MSEFNETLEEFVMRIAEQRGSVGVSHLVKYRGLTEKQAHYYLKSLHNQGVVRYYAAEQVGGAKEAVLVT